MHHLDDRAISELRLSYLQPVPRNLVHRAAIAEVFITDCLRVDDLRHLVAAQWPRDHVLYHPNASGLTDPLLFAETLRQALVYLAHAHHKVPLDHQFIGEFLEITVTEPAPLLVGEAPLPAVLDARWSWLDRRPGREKFRIDVDLLVNGSACGTGSLQVLAVDARRYRILRHRGGAAAATGGGAEAAPSTRLSPEAVGKMRRKDCVISPAGQDGPWLLAVDPRHAALYDHPSDHLPLMVMAEGFRQLGHLLSHRTPPGTPGAEPLMLSALRVDCRGWGERDVPTELVVTRHTPASPGGWDLAATQNGVRIADAHLVWTRPGVPGAVPRVPASRWEPAAAARSHVAAPRREPAVV